MRQALPSSQGRSGSEEVQCGHGRLFASNAAMMIVAIGIRPVRSAVGLTFLPIM